jgi:hypothetical protein
MIVTDGFSIVRHVFKHNFCKAKTKRCEVLVNSEK